MGIDRWRGDGIGQHRIIHGAGRKSNGADDVGCNRRTPESIHSRLLNSELGIRESCYAYLPGYSLLLLYTFNG